MIVVRMIIAEQSMFSGIIRQEKRCESSTDLWKNAAIKYEKYNIKIILREESDLEYRKETSKRI